MYLGDRVQWFRAEAEMFQWQEEHEIQQAKFMRCIRAFGTMYRVWKELAGRSSSLGRKAYANKTAARYAKMEQDAKQRFLDARYGHLLDAMKSSSGCILADYVCQERETEYQESGLDDLLYPPGSGFRSERR